MRLHLLDFDFSEDAEGHGSFEAMAAADRRHLEALRQEVVDVLDWATRTFGDAAPLEEGGEWDYQLHGVQEVVTPLAAHFDRATRSIALQPQGEGVPRVTLTLTVVGSEAFCAAFRAAFALD